MLIVAVVTYICNANKHQHNCILLLQGASLFCRIKVAAMEFIAMEVN